MPETRPVEVARDARSLHCLPQGALSHAACLDSAVFPGQRSKGSRAPSPLGQTTLPVAQKQRPGLAAFPLTGPVSGAPQRPGAPAPLLCYTSCFLAPFSQAKSAETMQFLTPERPKRFQTARFGGVFDRNGPQPVQVALHALRAARRSTVKTPVSGRPGGLLPPC